MSVETCFWMIRRRETGEWFRPTKGPTWRKQGRWVKEREKAKVYGKIGNVKSAMKVVDGVGHISPDGTLIVGLDLELVRFKVVEDGVE